MTNCQIKLAGVDQGSQQQFTDLGDWGDVRSGVNLDYNDVSYSGVNSPVKEREVSGKPIVISPSVIIPDTFEFEILDIKDSQLRTLHKILQHWDVLVMDDDYAIYGSIGDITKLHTRRRNNTRRHQLTIHTKDIYHQEWWQLPNAQIITSDPVSAGAHLEVRYNITTRKFWVYDDGSSPSFSFNSGWTELIGYDVQEGTVSGNEPHVDPGAQGNLWLRIGTQHESSGALQAVIWEGLNSTSWGGDFGVSSEFSKEKNWIRIT